MATSATQAVKLGADINGAASGDHFGLGIYSSADGSRVAVGGRFNDTTATNAGHVRVFDWSESTSTWVQVGNALNGEGAGDEFGWNITMTPDGSRFVTGGLYHDEGGSDRGATYIYEWSGTAWTQVGNTIYGIYNGGREGAGTAISSDGNRIATGAYRALSDNGRLRVFDYDSGTDTWVQVGSEFAGGSNSLFGYNVQIASGNKNRLIVSANYGGYTGNRGYFEVYDWNGAAWVLVDKVIAPTATDDKFGMSACISADGNRVATSERYAQSDDGAVYVYDWDSNSSSFVQVGSKIIGAYQNEEFGYGVSMSDDGRRLAIGGRYNDTDGFRRGCVRIYEWQPQLDYTGNLVPDQWYQYYPTIYGEGAGDEAGWDVHMSADGKRVFVGGPYNDDAGSDAGHFRAYSVPYLFWELRGESFDLPLKNAPANTASPLALSSDGLRLACGLPENEEIGGVDSGTVEVYEYDAVTAVWSQMGSTFGGGLHDRLGDAVDLSGDGSILAIGVSGWDVSSDEGAVRVYEWNGSVWNQLGSDIVGAASGDRFGKAVALSEDGTRLLVGAPSNDDGGTDAGQVQVYDWNGSVWSQVGSDLNGQATNTGWEFGEVVDIAGDGLSFVVGAPLYGAYIGGLQFRYGAAFIYKWSGSDWVQVGDEIVGNSSVRSFGEAVSIADSGTRIALSNTTNSDKGAYVYDYDAVTDTWDQVGSTLNGSELEALYKEGGPSGFNPALDFASPGGDIQLSGSGTRIVVGDRLAQAYIHTADEAASSFYWQQCGLTVVYEFDESAGDWAVLGFWRTAPSDTANQGSGVAISRDGIVFATAAPGDSTHPSYPTYSGSLDVYRQAELATVKVYDGADWNTEIVNYWSGSDWFVGKDVRYWDGLAWKSTV